MCPPDRTSTRSHRQPDQQSADTRYVRFCVKPEPREFSSWTLCRTKIDFSICALLRTVCVRVAVASSAKMRHKNLDARMSLGMVLCLTGEGVGEPNSELRWSWRGDMVCRYTVSNNWLGQGMHKHKKACAVQSARRSPILNTESLRLFASLILR